MNEFPRHRRYDAETHLNCYLDGLILRASNKILLATRIDADSTTLVRQGDTTTAEKSLEARWRPNNEPLNKSAFRIEQNEVGFSEGPPIGTCTTHCGFPSLVEFGWKR